MRGIGFTEQNCVCLLKILTFHGLFQELLNQYLACWYLFECIPHGDSEHGNEILTFVTKFVHFLTCRLHSAAWKALTLTVLPLVGFMMQKSLFFYQHF